MGDKDQREETVTDIENIGDFGGRGPPSDVSFSKNLQEMDDPVEQIVERQ